MSNLRPVLRGGTFYATGTIDGQRIRKSLGTGDRQRAQELCAHYEASLWKRAVYGEEAVRTFEEAALGYMEQGGEGRFLARIIRHFKGRAVGSIRPGDLRDAAMSLYPKATAATRNRQALVPARAVINHAADRGWCQQMRVRLFPSAPPRKHVPVDRQWLTAFMAQADADGLPHLAGIVLFMHQTAARRAEAVRLTGDHVDLDQRIAVLKRTKTGTHSVRHLTAELVLRIAALTPQPGQPVFRYTEPAAVNRRMKAVCKRAGIPYRSTHSAGRHSFATNAMASGARVRAAMDAGDWKSASLFLKTYVHEDEDSAREIAAAFDAQTGPVGTDLTHDRLRRAYGAEKNE